MTGRMFAVLTGDLTMPPNQEPLHLALFDENGDAVMDLTSVPTPDGGDILLTGFVTGTSSDLADTDTVNQALAKLQARLVAAETEEAAHNTGGEILITGYVIGSAAALAASDTVNGALAKLEKRVADLEAA